MPSISADPQRRLAELESRLARLESSVGGARDAVQSLACDWHWAVLAETMTGRGNPVAAYLAYQSGDDQDSAGAWWLTTVSLPVWPGYYPPAGEQIESGRAIRIAWQPAVPQRRHGRWYVVGAACPVDYYS